MRDIWFFSDPHFNHDRILTFENEDGSLIRPGFESIDHMNETIINNCNKLIKPNDYVYCCGDAFMGDKSKIGPTMDRMNGRWRLMLGNHDDVIKQKLYLYFEKIMLWRVFKEFNFTVTHIPLAPDQFRHNVGFNVHGHTHQRPDQSEQHMNICVERTNYMPLHLDEIRAALAKR